MSEQTGKDRAVVFQSLEKESFDQYPVWSFAENMQDYVPVLAFSPLPEDRSPLFVKARLKPARGPELEGYVVYQAVLYAIGIFVNGQEFTFNRRLLSRAGESSANLFRAMGTKPFELFPLEFVTDFSFADGEKLAGVFDFTE